MKCSVCDASSLREPEANLSISIPMPRFSFSIRYKLVARIFRVTQRHRQHRQAWDARWWKITPAKLIKYIKWIKTPSDPDPIPAPEHSEFFDLIDHQKTPFYAFHRIQTVKSNVHSPHWTPNNEHNEKSISQMLCCFLFQNILCSLFRRERRKIINKFKCEKKKYTHFYVGRVEKD